MRYFIPTFQVIDANFGVGLNGILGVEGDLADTFTITDLGARPDGGRYIDPDLDSYFNFAALPEADQVYAARVSWGTNKTTDVIGLETQFFDYLIYLDGEPFPDGGLFNIQNMTDIPSSSLGSAGTFSLGDFQMSLAFGETFDAIDDTQPAAAIDALVGDTSLATNISNFTFTGADEGRIISEGLTIAANLGLSDFEIGSSLFLTTGIMPELMNTVENFTYDLSMPGDADLSAAASAAFPPSALTQDAMVIEFDLFVPATATYTGISFDLVFGTEEYPELLNTSSADIAAVFVNGQNYALFENDATQPISVNGDTLFGTGNLRTNQQGQYEIEYDAFSNTLRVFAPIQSGTNEIKIGIADVGDALRDSGLFVGNLQTHNLDVTGAFVERPTGSLDTESILGSDAPEIFSGILGDDTINPGLGQDIITLGDGAETVYGLSDELNGDLVFNFGEGDGIFIEGGTFNASDANMSGDPDILRIDTDNDGQDDFFLTLQGDFAFEELEFVSAVNGVEISFPTPEPIEPPVEEPADPPAEDPVDPPAEDPVDPPAEDPVDPPAEDPQDPPTEEPSDPPAEEPVDPPVEEPDNSLTLNGTAAGDTLVGDIGNDTLNGMDGNDRLNGMDGDDLIFGGTSENDLSDTIFGGGGNDTIHGGYGNDELSGMDGNDQILGGFGVDTLIGGRGDDTITGSAFSDLLFGNNGDDFVNGGFGSDRINGGAGSDSFFHLGIFDHGSDWIQDYYESQNDVLVYGGQGSIDDFQVNFTRTDGAGARGIEEAFVIHKPTEQILWALVDGGGLDTLTIRIAGQEFDLLA